MTASGFGQWVPQWAGRIAAHWPLQRDAADIEEAPLRAELLTADQIAQHGKSLAAVHELTTARAPDRLLARLASNEKLLVQVCALLAPQGEQQRSSPAGEWLLDNFYLIEEEIRTAKLHFPAGFSRELPRLRSGPSAGLPRVYDLALQAVAHGDVRLGRGILSRFVASYQTVKVLKLGELWAIPIMLRLALIENLRRVGAHIAACREQRNLAAAWAEKMLDVAERDPKGLILVIADMARSDPPMTGPFVAELARRLQGRSAALALPLTWIEQRLHESHRSIEQMVQAEAQQQATDQVSVSHSIGALRMIGAMDWREFVETLSRVEQTLREDPSDVYARMDFATRDSYRHVVEAIARTSPLSEPEVARAAVDLAADSAARRNEEHPHLGHVGYYLIDAGRTELERVARARPPLGLRWRRAAARRGLLHYSFAVIGLTLALSGGIAWRATQGGQDPLWTLRADEWLWVPALVLILATSQLAVALANWAASLWNTPRALPRMDFSFGIPPSQRTLVVVPTMLGSPQGIDDLVEALEVRFVVNRDAQLHFGLLTDFHDAAQETLPGDEALLRYAREKIEALNHKYSALAAPSPGVDRFFLFHRPRRWNPRERVWMGHERKRGKLADLNALLRSHERAGPADRFSLIVGDTSPLRGVRYVITLDTDTQLPRDAAWQFVGTMAHPLNRPRFGGTPEAPRVVAGYGILQPRVGVSLPGTLRSRYARLFGGEPGIDPYTRAVSDIYQDLFDEGSFIGKGIYDVDAFEHVLGGRLPENRILSHDLLEGCYARSGLISDVQLFEESPWRYDADVCRRQRWIRGDWQIIAWLWPRLRLSPGGPQDGRPAVTVRNPLSPLSRVKVVDNLRRSLTPAALTALLLLGWSVLQAPWLWTLWGVAILFAPPLAALLVDLWRKPASLRAGQHVTATLPSASRQFGQATLSLACLPYEAAFSLDAVLRTLGRLWITRRRLLEWQASADLALRAPPGSAQDLRQTLVTMWVSPALAGATALALSVARPAALAVAAPVLALWLLSPVVVWWLSRPLQRKPSTLSAAQNLFLRLLARRTWAFFDTFVGPSDHALPPDNVQEHPVARIAHRTSPTNIGLSLLANLAAYDFGYLTLGQLITRTGATLDTMEALDRHESHFYNWYDTQSLQPLRPAYVSTVDSGNLAGHLLTLRSGLLALAAEPPQLPRLFAGLADTVQLLRQALAAPAVDSPLVRLEALLSSAQAGPPQEPHTLGATFDGLASCAAELLESMGPAAPSAPSAPSAPAPEAGEGAELPAIDEAWRWAEALDRQCRAALAELQERWPAAAQPANPTGRAEQAGQAGDMPALPTRRSALLALAARAGALAEMDYGFLYDAGRNLLAIGYNVDERRRDSGYYDLLASEVRLCSFVAVAQGKVPQESWFALGRLLTTVDGQPILLSWSGSMFEYLMPMLVMPCYENTLLDQTMRAAVERQIHYGRQRGVPWGMSESGYHATDTALNYQYRAFGVPGLGLKRGLAEDLVVAPYATVMALMVEPRAACQNLVRLAEEGLTGAYGYYEAIDYTPARLPRGRTGAVVRSFMAHHQGMSLLALAHLLLGQPMQRRFEADPQLQATLLLLQERIPKAVAFHPHTADRAELRPTFGTAEAPLRTITTPDTPTPEVQLLSNGNYHVMVTHAGGGYSRWKDLAVTRWREDTTCDAWGSFCYLRDTETGTCWSSTHQPTLWKPDSFEAIFTEGRAEFRRRDQGIDAYTEIVVSPEDDIELRRLRLTNLGRTQRHIELTSYTEVVLAPHAADAQHPAFSKLFVQTERVHDLPALLCTRRPRSVDEPTPWMCHLMAVHGVKAGAASHETDRARFIGRGRTLSAPQAMCSAADLSGSAGSVLDPIAAMRRVVTLEPGQTATIDMVYGMAESRDGCLALLAKYADRRLADRVFELAWTHGQVVLRQLNATEADTELYARLASAVIYAQSTQRADSALLLRNRRSQSGLWGYGISGDLPIVLLQIRESAHIDLVRQMVQAHAWWRLKGLAVDLVIWNEERDLYRQRLHEQILGLIAAGVEAHVVDRPGGIFVRHAEQISNEDRVLLQAVARVLITDRHGTLAQQALRKPVAERRTPPFVATRAPVVAHGPATPPPSGLLFFNGTGGFTPDGREYVIAPPAGTCPPAPWVNVLANPRFGCVVSEAGSGYTWCENAHELRLTPWHNDPVCDSGGEAIYLRDEASGQVWLPTALPRGEHERNDGNPSPYVTRHGFGYSVFEHDEAGIHSELTVYVAMDAAIKFSVLRLRNDGTRERRLSATGYVEWVLGDLRAKTAPHITTDIAPENGALYARNAFSNDFGDWVGFFDVDEADRLFGTVTCDRSEFIGRNGSLQRPAALTRTRLSGRTGAALDPCSAIQVPFDLLPGQTREVVFRLGMGRSTDEAGQLVRRFRGGAAAHEALAAVHRHWEHTLGRVQVQTPDAALNLLANGWLVYQTLACRMWARSGFYQSGGAFGFRDQLQDAMALVHSRPQLLRDHLLLCASRQFVEGDVQHWWHPPSGRGVRTHISDDYLWLPLALCRYVQATHDTGVLTESVPFIEGRLVSPGDDSYFDLPGHSIHSASLYQHAVRALLHALRFGAHGLPLMGGGDWNDGMNLVGHEGRGESVWLGFFLCDVLRQFATLARGHGDEPVAQRCDGERVRLQESLQAHAWDGDWYRRAFFDDGTPLGSAANAECQIDSIAQSWSVLSGVADAGRARHAMDAVASRLVRAEHGLVQLLAPPFDGQGPSPGYISGYVPGVRENGGQYTHGAIWAAMAFAALGDRERAWQLMDLINPLHHARTAAEVEIYKIEPYVVAADVYSVAPHTARGGWSWYTGSAGWMYRLVLESLLGVQLETTQGGARLHLAPCLPRDWPGFTFDYRYRETPYHIEVTQGSAEPGVTLDGVARVGMDLPLVDDGQPHLAIVRLASP
ncbi:MAG: glucoamylase family protein [Rubrivivax sp.]|nr:glucoamylase family protein [Rubrivivax sp.]